MGYEQIMAGLARHEGLFSMERDGLGGRLMDVATESVRTNFDRKQSPAGEAWPDLSSDYARWKEVHFPGLPMGKLEGAMEAGIEGDRLIEPDSALYTFGTTPEAQDHCAWFSEGDPYHNRPARPFVGLNEAAGEKSRATLDDHFKDNV